jgi:hypothetical protein
LVLALFFTDEHVYLRGIFSSITGNIVHGLVSPPADPASVVSGYGSLYQGKLMPPVQVNG